MLDILAVLSYAGKCFSASLESCLLNLCLNNLAIFRCLLQLWFDYLHLFRFSSTMFQLFTLVSVFSQTLAQVLHPFVGDRNQ